MALRSVSGCVACALLSWCVVACGGDDGGEREQQPTMEPAPSSGLEWAAETCPTGYGGECTYLATPLDWNAPDGDELHLLLMRSRTRAAADGEAPQLWFLAGGPGQSAAVFTDMFDYLHYTLPEFDFYTIEHRGIGASNKLYCDSLERYRDQSQTDAVIACGGELLAGMGDELAFYSTTGAAHDLEAALAATANGAPQHIVAASYGTYWAERYLQLATPPGAVVLDSIVPPDNRSLARWDEGFEPVVESLAALCDADPSCAAHFTSPALDFLLALLDKVAAGHCPELGASEADLSAMIANFAGDWVLRELLFPMFYRYDRCSPEDVEVWTNFQNGIVPSAEWRDRVLTDCAALHAHVMFSELWDDPSPDAALIEERRAGARFWPGGVEIFAPAYAPWPRYAADEFVGKWPTFTTPILALNGDLDALTPYEKASVIGAQLSGETQHFFKVPYSAHAAAFASLCTVQLLHRFLLHPSDALDASCLEGEVPPDLSGQYYSPSLLGLDDPWDGVPSASAGANALPRSSPGRVDWPRLLGELRKRSLFPRALRSPVKP